MKRFNNWYNCGKVAFTLAEGGRSLFRHSELVSESKNNHRKAAFTLAEVLITLGIIGIVAAMTMPTLITKYQKNQTITRLKRTYSVISNAVQMSIADNGFPETWDTGLSSSDFAKKYFVKYFNNSKFYEPGELNLMEIKKKYTWLDGSEIPTTNNSTKSFITHSNDPLIELNDGTLILINYNAAHPTSYYLEVDIDGYRKGFNQAGKDYFSFVINTTNGKVRTQGSTYTRETLLGYCSKSAAGTNRNCSALIEKDNWEIKDDYPW